MVIGLGSRNDLAKKPMGVKEVRKNEMSRGCSKNKIGRGCSKNEIGQRMPKE